MKGIILCGGKGTRLDPLTRVTNKHLLPVYDKPMILYPLETLRALNVKDILVVTGGEHIGAIAEFLGDGTEYKVKLSYKIQEGAGGIAEALGLAEDFVGNNEVVVVLGDNIFDNDALFEEWLRFNRNHPCILFTKKVKDPERFGVAKIKNGQIVSIIEKPKKPISNSAITGLYIYPPTVFDVIKTLKPSRRGELEITDVNNHYVKRGECANIEIRGFWSDAGTFESLLKSANWVKAYE